MVRKENGELSEIQKLVLEIFRLVVGILEREGYTYYLLCGTLLGAVRHKGFIPWDDDIDIGMPRKDYERFLKEIPDMLPEGLKLHTYRNDRSHHYYFSRIVNPDYALRRMGSIVERDEDIWIDIFPLDGMPDHFLVRQWHKLRLLTVRTLYHLSCLEKVNIKRPGRPFYERLIIAAGLKTGLGRKGNTYDLLEQQDRLLKKYPYEGARYIIEFSGQYRFKSMFLYSDYGKGRPYLFEGLKVNGPVNYDRILTSIYGDYMTPPEHKNRNAHRVILIKNRR